MLMRLIMNATLALAAVVTVGALACAEETVIEQRSYEALHGSYEAPHADAAQPDQERVVVDVVPPAPVDARVVEEQTERMIDERTVTHERPVVEQRTDTVVTTVHDDDDDTGDDDDDGAGGDDEAY